MSADGFGTGVSDAQQTLQSFWPRVMEEIRNLTLVHYTYRCVLDQSINYTNSPRFPVSQTQLNL